MFFEILKKFPKDALWNTDIDNIMYGIKLVNLNYLGTFAFGDRIKKMNTNDCYIINNRRRDDPLGGEHWLSVFMFNGKKYIYDSFLRKTNKGTLEFPKKYIEMDINDKKFKQNVSETDCGARSISMVILCDIFGIQNVFDME